MIIELLNIPLAGWIPYKNSRSSVSTETIWSTIILQIVSRTWPVSAWKKRRSSIVFAWMACFVLNPSVVKRRCGFRVAKRRAPKTGWRRRKRCGLGKIFDDGPGSTPRALSGGLLFPVFFFSFLFFFDRNQDRMTRVCPRYPNMSGGSYVSRVKLRPGEFLLPFNQP